MKLVKLVRKAPIDERVESQIDTLLLLRPRRHRQLDSVSLSLTQLKLLRKAPDQAERARWHARRCSGRAAEEGAQEVDPSAEEAAPAESATIQEPVPSAESAPARSSAWWPQPPSAGVLSSCPRPGGLLLSSFDP